MALYARMKKEYPNLHGISFEVGEYTGETKLSGHYHIGNECKIWNSISELYALISEAKGRRIENEILYQQFEGIL